MADSRGGVTRALERLAELQLATPWRIIGAVLLAAVVCLGLASKLTLKTGFGDLLPSGKRSVIVADEVKKRLKSTSTFIVVAEGSDDEGLKKFVDAAAPELAKLPKELVTSVDSGVQATQAFFEQNRLLYAPTALVDEAHQEIEERYEYEIGSRNGSWLDDDEPPPELTEATLKKRIEAKVGGADEAAAKYPGGYYLDPVKHVVALRMLTPLSSGDVEASTKLQRLAREVIAKLEPERFDAAIRVGFTGDLLTSAELHEQIVSDSKHVGAWGVALILGVVLLYFLRIRTLLVMALTVAVGPPPGQ